MNALTVKEVFTLIALAGTVLAAMANILALPAAGIVNLVAQGVFGLALYDNGLESLEFLRGGVASSFSSYLSSLLQDLQLFNRYRRGLIPNRINVSWL